MTISVGNLKYRLLVYTSLSQSIAKGRNLEKLISVSGSIYFAIDWRVFLKVLLLKNVAVVVLVEDMGSKLFFLHE